jgi:hypothetical protein
MSRLQRAGDHPGPLHWSVGRPHAKKGPGRPALVTQKGAPRQGAATLEVIEAMTVEAILNCASRSAIP